MNKLHVSGSGNQTRIKKITSGNDQNSLNENETTTSSCSENEDDYDYENEENDENHINTTLNNNSNNNNNNSNNLDPGVNTDDEYVCENFVQTYSILEPGSENVLVVEQHQKSEFTRETDMLDKVIDEEEEIVEEEYFIQEQHSKYTDDNNNNVNNSNNGHGNGGLFVKKTPIAVQVLPENGNLSVASFNGNNIARNRANNIGNSLLTPCVNGNFKSTNKVNNNGLNDLYFSNQQQKNFNNNNISNHFNGNQPQSIESFNNIQGMVFYDFCFVFVYIFIFFINHTNPI